MPSPTQARIVVVGAGSIGGYVAFELARAGHEVVLGVRSPFERLVVIDEHGQRHELSLPVLTDPTLVPEADWVILATKAHQTEAAAPWLRGACGSFTRGVIVMQNGVEHEARVRPHVGAAPVLPCVVRCGAEAIAPGHIVHHGFANFDVPAGPIADALAPVFADTALQLVSVDDFTTVAWQKLISNVTCSPLTALTRRRLVILRDEAIADLAVQLAAECLRIGEAAGAKIDETMARPIVEGMRTVNPQMGSSMLYDQLAERPTEYEALTGAVVRFGRKFHIPTPMNDAIYALLAVASADWLSAVDG
ncbi:MAG TPA: 2-dehydropantoate 2-reductase [Acidimicrobiales bacterium]|nr:2-dehydropantoate 2-reductase [Acidimicrobiales bacterium]